MDSVPVVSLLCAVCGITVVDVDVDVDDVDGTGDGVCCSCVSDTGGVDSDRVTGDCPEAAPAGPPDTEDEV